MILNNKLIGRESVQEIGVGSFDYFYRFRLRDDVLDFLKEKKIPYTDEDVTDICNDVVTDIIHFS